MKKINPPKSQEQQAQAKPAALHLCFDGTLGCKEQKAAAFFKWVPIKESNGVVTREDFLCDTCHAKIAVEYGVKHADAAIASTAIKNEAWHFARIASKVDLSEVNLRTKVRSLFLALGVPVVAELPSERSLAVLVRDSFPTLRQNADLDGLAKSVGIG